MGRSADHRGGEDRRAEVMSSDEGFAWFGHNYQCLDEQLQTVTNQETLRSKTKIGQFKEQAADEGFDSGGVLRRILGWVASWKLDTVPGATVWHQCRFCGTWMTNHEWLFWGGARQWCCH